MEPSDLRRRARLRYELGRLRFATPYGVAAAVIVACAWFVSSPSVAGLALGAALVVTCIALPFAARSLARQVRVGLLAGLVPMVAALASVEAAGCAKACTPWCAPLCALAGVMVGLWLGTLRARSGVRWAALVVAALTAAVGCLPIGAGTLLGALLGIAVGSAPIVVLAASRRG